MRGVPLSVAHPAVAARWATDVNGPLEDHVTSGSNKEYYWYCSLQDHYYSKTVKKQVGYGDRCPACEGRIIVSEFNDFGTLYPSLLEEWSEKNTINPRSISPHSQSTVYWRCNQCFIEWRDQVRSRTEDSTRRCPDCYPRKRLSSLEEEIYRILRSHFQGIIARRAKVLEGLSGKLELDFYLPEINVAFEVQDFATHSPTRDDEIATYRKSQLGDTLKKGPTYHEIKRKLALEQLSCTVYEIWEDSIVRNAAEDYIVSVLNGQSKNLNTGGDTSKAPVRARLLIEKDLILKKFWAPDLNSQHFNELTTKDVCDWRCDEGHVFKQRVNKLLAASKPCPYCDNRLVLPGVNDIVTMGLADQYSERNFLPPDRVLFASAYPVLWRHKNHVFSMSPHSRHKGYRCNLCYGSNFDPNVNSIAAIFPLLAESWGTGNFLGAHEVKVRTKDRKRYQWRCLACREDFTASLSARKAKPHCHFEFPLHEEATKAIDQSLSTLDKIDR